MAAEKATERLWFTADRSELVPAGDERAAFLACIPGRPQPDVPVSASKPSAKRLAKPKPDVPVSASKPSAKRLAKPKPAEADG